MMRACEREREKERMLDKDSVRKCTEVEEDEASCILLDPYSN